MFDYPEPQSRFHSVEDMTPYFQSRAKRKRVCPGCHKSALEVKPTLNPNAGVDHCPECGYFQTIIAPKAAQVPEDWKPPKRRCRIIEFSTIARNGKGR